MRRLVSLIAGMLHAARAEPWGPGAALAQHAAADATLHASAAALSLTRDPRVGATCSVVVAYDRLANGDRVPPGPHGDYDRVFTMRVDVSV